MNRRVRQAARSRRGFTLVEMLVAVALVVLMMTMFAEIFALASNAVSTQKGAAVNDQKVRTFTTLLRTDIENRTFRDVMPFPFLQAGQEGAFDASFTNEIKERRKGYFAISENDPNDPTDDVLAFTVKVNTSLYGYQDALLFGKSGSAGGVVDHPENDDGIVADGLGASTMAEIVYFLRAGNLYRSVMLIREPYAPDPAAGTGTFDEDQPSNAGTPIFTDAMSQFWATYDYSAFRHPTTGVVMLHSDNSLNNDRGTTGMFPIPPGGTLVPPSLGIPHLRFGHTINGYGGTGQPDEFTQDPTSPTTFRFVGRPLKQELADTVAPVYPYPGDDDPTAASPLLAGTWNPNTGLVNEYGDVRTRRGAELLVPNVHEFDIQVWDDDPRLPGPIWTDVGAARDTNGDSDGDGFTEGFYDGGNCRNTTYCPGTNRYRFDTWHPNLGDDAPFRGVWPHTPSLTPRVTSPDMQPGQAASATFNGDDDGINGVNDAGELGWIGSDDERPLRQIRVRVRFYDVNSGQVRQLTLTLPLTDNGVTTAL